MSLPKSGAVRPGDDLRPGVGSGRARVPGPTGPPLTLQSLLHEAWEEWDHCLLRSRPPRTHRG